jgi:hypothetical protein
VTRNWVTGANLHSAASICFNDMSPTIETAGTIACYVILIATNRIVTNHSLKPRLPTRVCAVACVYCELLPSVLLWWYRRALGCVTRRAHHRHSRMPAIPGQQDFMTGPDRDNTIFGSTSAAPTRSRSQALTWVQMAATEDTNRGSENRHMHSCFVRLCNRSQRLFAASNKQYSGLALLRIGRRTTG